MRGCSRGLPSVGAAVLLAWPCCRRALMARLRRVAMTRGALPVRIWCGPRRTLSGIASAVIQRWPVGSRAHAGVSPA